MDPHIDLDATSRPPRPLDQTRDKLRTLHYSYRTEQQYLQWVRRFILLHDKRHPRTMGAPEVEAFLTHLAVTRKVLASTQNQALAALLFLYQNVLEIELPWLHDAVRVGKGGKDRVTILPEAIVDPLQRHLEVVRAQHSQPMKRGYDIRTVQ